MNNKTEQYWPAEAEEHVRFARERFPGNNYLEWLIWLHQTAKPKSYLEIGVEHGKSLQFAQSFTKAIGIDPAFQLIYSQEAWVKLFRMPSDDFFIQYDLKEVLGEKSVNLVFLDGLHTFDQTLKDFINIEHYSNSKTIVAIHDTFPVVPITASRERKTGFWLGDTWKVVLILKKLRPDLKIATLPTFPSGLTLVTGLNRKSDLLFNKLDMIVAQWLEVELEPYMAEIETHLNAVENDYLKVSKLLKLK